MPSHSSLAAESLKRRGGKGKEGSRRVREGRPKPDQVRRARLGGGAGSTPPPSRVVARLVLPTLFPPLVHSHRVELTSQLILALHAGFITSYLLSPVHFLTLLIRTLTQIHLFTPPRKFRSLRLVLVAWALVNALSVLIHALDGSKGTKGSGWHGKGIIVDIIGQIHTPSRVKLITLDLIIAAIQFVVVLLTFAAAETASAGTPSALLGDNIDEWSDDDEEEDGPEASNADDRPIKRLIPGDRGVDLYGTPVVNIRLRAVWQEVARGTRVPNDAVRMEEGRAESGTPG